MGLCLPTGPFDRQALNRSIWHSEGPMKNAGVFYGKFGLGKQKDKDVRVKWLYL